MWNENLVKGSLDQKPQYIAQAMQSGESLTEGLIAALDVVLKNSRARALDSLPINYPQGHLLQYTRNKKVFEGIGQTIQETYKKIVSLEYSMKKIETDFGKDYLQGLYDYFSIVRDKYSSVLQKGLCGAARGLSVAHVPPGKSISSELRSTLSGELVLDYSVQAIHNPIDVSYSSIGPWTVHKIEDVALLIAPEGSESKRIQIRLELDHEVKINNLYAPLVFPMSDYLEHLDIRDSAGRMTYSRDDVPVKSGLELHFAPVRCRFINIHMDLFETYNIAWTQSLINEIAEYYQLILQMTLDQKDDPELDNLLTLPETTEAEHLIMGIVGLPQFEARLLEYKRSGTSVYPISSKVKSNTYRAFVKCKHTRADLSQVDNVSDAEVLSSLITSCHLRAERRSKNDKFSSFIYVVPIPNTADQLFSEAFKVYDKISQPSSKTSLAFPTNDTTVQGYLIGAGGSGRSFNTTVPVAGYAFLAIPQALWVLGSEFIVYNLKTRTTPDTVRPYSYTLNGGLKWSLPILKETGAQNNLQIELIREQGFRHVTPIVSDIKVLIGEAQ